MLYAAQNPPLTRVHILHARARYNTPQRKKKRTIRSTSISTRVEVRATKRLKTRWEA